MKTYLGDGVYLNQSDGMIELTTSNGVRDTNIIYLEPEVLSEFLKYLGKLIPFGSLDTEFLEAMNDIWKYGLEKYEESSFQGRALKGNTSRPPIDRCKPEEIARHAKEHFDMYLQKIPHDHFNTLSHQLAAVAFNAMMEFILSKNEKFTTNTEL
jgi:hypothetical protein